MITGDQAVEVVQELADHEDQNGDSSDVEVLAEGQPGGDERHDDAQVGDVICGEVWKQGGEAGHANQRLVDRLQEVGVDVIEHR